MSDEGYPGAPNYEQQPGSGQQPPYEQQPSYEQQPAFGQQPGYEQQPPSGEQPGYPQQPPSGEQPGYPQQPPYPQQPTYPQPPAYPPPPAYPAPPPSAEQPGYGQQQPVYGDPQYPTTQFPAAQYPGAQSPGAQYPGAQYPEAQYPPGAAPPYPPAPPAAGGGRRRGLWLSALIALLVAAGLGAYFTFAGSSASANTPKGAVSKLLDAGKSGNVNAAKKALCMAAANDSVINQLRSGGRITSYTIQSVRTVDSTHAVATVRLTTTTLTNPEIATFPVVKEAGSWKACPTQLDVSGSGSGPLPSNFPTGSSLFPSSVPSLSLPPSLGPSVSVPGALPTGANGINPCSFSGNEVEQAATTFMGLAELGQTTYALGCVYKDSVPRSVIASLRATGSGDYFAPTGTSGNTVEFASIDGKSHVRVTMTKESDGTYYVTKVEQG